MSSRITASKPRPSTCSDRSDALDVDVTVTVTRYQIERRDGTTDGLGDEVLFASENEAWDNAEVAFGGDPASDEGGVRSWLRIVMREKAFEGEVTLLPAADGSGYASWGEPSHWVSGDLLSSLDEVLDDSDRRDVLHDLAIEAGAVCDADPGSLCDEDDDLEAQHLSHGWSVYDPNSSARWWPAERFRFGIENSDDPSEAILEMCREKPTRGEWID